MEFRILGPLEVRRGRPRARPRRAEAARAAGVLLLHANEVVSARPLIDALWEDGPPETAAKALQVYVSQLRKPLGRERVRDAGLRATLLRVEPRELDLARFQRLRAEGRPARRRCTLWRGPPLADFAYERFAQPRDRPAGGAPARLPRGADRRATSRSGGTPTSSASSRRSSPSIRCASGCAAS